MPISIADMVLYRQYDGDLDGLSRSRHRDSRTIEAAWRVVDDLRQRAFIAATEGGSEKFKCELESELAAHFADPQALAAFRDLVAGDLKKVVDPGS